MDPVTIARVSASHITAEAVEPAPDAQALPPPSEEQVKAIETVFVQQQDDARAAHGLLGCWASAYLLHDLAVEHFWRKQDEDDEEREPEVAEEETP